MEIVIKSKNNHDIEHFGNNELRFEVVSETVLIRAHINGLDHEVDFDLSLIEFQTLVETLKLATKILKKVIK